MLKLSQMTGVVVYAPKGSKGKAAGTYTRLGKVHLTVFAPSGTRVVGFLVSRPDVAGMVKRDDVFFALDAMAPVDGGVRATRASMMPPAGAWASTGIAASFGRAWTPRQPMARSWDT